MGHLLFEEIVFLALQSYHSLRGKTGSNHFASHRLLWLHLGEVLQVEELLVESLDFLFLFDELFRVVVFDVGLFFVAGLFGHEEQFVDLPLQFELVLCPVLFLFLQIEHLSLQLSNQKVVILLLVAFLRQLHVCFVVKVPLVFGLLQLELQTLQFLHVVLLFVQFLLEQLGFLQKLANLNIVLFLLQSQALDLLLQLHQFLVLVFQFQLHVFVSFLGLWSSSGLDLGILVVIGSHLEKLLSLHLEVFVCEKFGEVRKVVAGHVIQGCIGRFGVLVEDVLFEVSLDEGLESVFGLLRKHRGLCGFEGVSVLGVVQSDYSRLARFP